MSDSFTNDPGSGTLYDPSPEESGSSASGDDRVSLRLSMPEERAERLRAVAQQIGLSPSTVAKRAIEMVCDEVVTIQKDSRSPSVLVEQYQARLDLLHSVKQPQSDESDAGSQSVPDTADVEVPGSPSPAEED